MSPVLGRERTTWICRVLRFLLCALTSLAAVACAPSLALPPDLATYTPSEPTAASPTPTRPAPIMTTPDKRIPAFDQPESSGPARPLPFDSPAGLAAYDLAMRLGIDPEAVVVLSLEEVQLTAADLPCAPAASESEPAMGGEGVLGQTITLAVAGKEYVYRAIGWDIALCMSEAELADLSSPTMRSDVNGAPTQAAREVLAQRIGVSAESVEVLSVEAVSWPDTSLGCAEPGMMYAQVITPGYRMRLQAGGRIYAVHSDMQRVVICDKALDTD